MIPRVSSTPSITFSASNIALTAALAVHRDNASATPSFNESACAGCFAGAALALAGRTSRDRRLGGLGDGAGYGARLAAAARLMPNRRRFTRRRFWIFGWLVNALVLLAGAWLAGFLVFLLAIWAASPPDPIPHTDGIVALTGGDGRVSAALALLAEQAAPALLISGAGKGTYLGDFTADDSAAATRYAAEITLGHAAASTRGNA